MTCCADRSPAFWSDTNPQRRASSRRKPAVWSGVLPAGRARWWRRTTCRTWLSTGRPLDDSLRKIRENISSHIHTQHSAVSSLSDSGQTRSLDKCQNTGVGGWTGQDVYWTPLRRDVWGLIYTPSHIKQRKPLKSNKHFDTCWVVKREGLMAQITHPAESCSSRTGETDTRWTKLNHFISRDVKKKQKKFICLLTSGHQTQDRVRALRWRLVALRRDGVDSYWGEGLRRPEGAVQLHHVQRVSAAMIHWQISQC